ncbi:MAG TPA: DUF433 domain-containing protein [Blastocatellia bacterium]|nr:DUF433 domain-containing protein [Blastocatellia bacterium]
MTLSQTTPLFEDQDGAIRLTGSRIPLDTVVYEFNQEATAEQIQDSFPSLSLRSIMARSLSIWSIRPPWMTI